MASELLVCGARGESCQGWDKAAFAFFSRSQSGAWQVAVCLKKGTQAPTAFKFKEAVSGDTAHPFLASRCQVLEISAFLFLRGPQKWLSRGMVIERHGFYTPVREVGLVSLYVPFLAQS